MKIIKTASVAKLEFNLKELDNLNLYNILEPFIKEAKKMKNPCWKNYKMVGTKTKNGKEVPNCVPKE
jgi:hypothetical protein